ncbi:MAG TPA: biopolymer transporter ExbD [Arachidicoccus soli]|nr:biopolymer transporter ExbD [Arachidicoccus soli]
MAIERNNKIKLESGSVSMTDLVFLLLIFFIIASTSSQKNTPVQLPQPKEQLKPARETVITTVVVTKDNLYQMVLGSKEEGNNPFGLKSKGASYDQIRDFLIQQVEKTPEKKLKIAGARKANYEAVFQILALSKARGWKPVLSYE